MKRASGILMHITSLPGKYGIGTMGQSAYDFVDFLEKSGQRYWQILPIGPTSYGNSPYSSYSTFAGNPYLIDLDLLVEDGLLTQAECEAHLWGEDPCKVDFDAMYTEKLPLLKKAFLRDKPGKAYEKFLSENKDWAEDYALFMAIKQDQEMVQWYDWEDDLRLREPKALEKAKTELKEEIDFQLWMQYIFFAQFAKLKKYANAHGVKLFGDIPIYVAGDSADTWSHPELFCFDEDGRPSLVAGVPPDYFSETGQLWGNPCYRWEEHKKTGYAWWNERIRRAFLTYDVMRIDHFRGFDEYWAVPAEEETAINGEWKKGPGIQFFRQLHKKLGDLEIIAEDLGVMTPGVEKLLADSGYPGMKVLEFAFDGSDNAFLPHNHIQNCVVYTGTHDNDTLIGWLNIAPKKEVEYARRYLNLSHEESYSWGFIRAAFQSVADLCIIPMQDYLLLDTDCRMNTPSTVGNNWEWRMEEGAADEILSEDIREMVELYHRWG